MKKILFMMGVAAMALSSCSQEEVVGVNTSKNDDKAISFRVRSYKPSRAMEFSTYNLDDFMVFGYKGCPDDGDVLVPYFEDGLPVKFSRDGLLFTSPTPYYYPVDGSWLYFAAYAPSTLDMKPFGTLGGIKLDNFTVDADITKQIDIICANGGSNLEPDEPDQELTFTHALTKVFISEVSNSDSRYKYEIVGLKFGNIHNSGNYEYRGDKAYDEIIRNGIFDEEGYIQDYTGNGHFWKPTGEQTGEMTYLFAEPIVLDKTTTSALVMSGDDTESTGEEAHEAFMLIPQQLSAAFLNEEGSINSANFESGMSYIAFLVRITYLPTGEVIYPYAEGVEAISKTIGETTYAWAAFPVSSLWAPGSYIDYYVDFSKGAGYVAPGASTEVELQPILGREIKFTEEVFSWDDGSLITVDHNNQLGIDVTEEEDPFGED